MSKEAKDTSYNYTRYMSTYAGRELIKKYPNPSLEKGTWCIKGEDSNCDWGGYHHNPILGYREGNLLDVIKYAVNLKSFWTWGGGGYIEKVEIKKISTDTNKELNDLKKEEKELAARLKEISKKIERLS
jgi:hypothetical protein